MSRLVALLLLLSACAPDHHHQPVDDDQDDAEAPPSWPSVAWILTQPYGEACDDGARAADDAQTTFVEHPDSGRCTFTCTPAFAALCSDVSGFCDERELCVSRFRASP